MVSGFGPDSLVRMRRHLLFVLGLVAPILAWIMSVAGHPPPPNLSRLLVIGGLVIAGWWWIRFVDGQARHCAATMRFGRHLLWALAVAAVIASFAGIDHEASIRFNGDERTYVGHARQINQGHWVRDSFIYPHLLYNLSALTLWGRSLFTPAVDGVIAAIWGSGGEEETVWILLHGLTALFGMATPVLTFMLGRRLANARAGLVGGFLALASPLILETNHLLLCDVPAAFFVLATLVVVARLVDEERWSTYLVAGALAGLAAGSKWPAGLVALAIALVWLRWRVLGWRRREAVRRWQWGLFGAAGTAIATLLASTPSLMVIPEKALYGEKDLFFGVRLYANRSWAGIAKESNAAYYGQLLLESFGWFALVAGAIGLLLLARGRRGRVMLVGAYPLLQLGLALSMSIAVKRTLHPILAALAALLGIGLIRLFDLAWSRGWLWRLTAGLGLTATLLVPAVAGTLEVVSLATPTTRDACVTWIAANVPKGTRILREHYTPRIEDPWDSEQRRFAVRWSPEELADPHNDYLLVAGPAYSRFMDPALHTKPFHKEIQAEYERLFATHEKVAAFEPSRTRRGPLLELYRLRGQRTEPLVLPSHVDQLRGWPSTWTMRPDGRRPIEFAHDGQFVTFRLVLPAGDVRITAEASGEPGGRLALFTPGDTEIAAADLDEQRAAIVAAPGGTKNLLRLWLPAGAVLTGLRIEAPAS